MYNSTTADWECENVPASDTNWVIDNVTLKNNSNVLEVNDTYMDENFINWSSESDLNVNFSNSTDYANESVYWNDETSQADLNVNSSNYSDYTDITNVLGLDSTNIDTLDWTILQNYPVECPVGQAVRVIADVLTCIDVAGADTNWVIDNDTIINNTNVLEVNSTWLNETIDARENDTIYYDGVKYISINPTNNITMDETVLNATIDDRDSDTTYSADDVFIDINGTNYIVLNTTKMNLTYIDRDSMDTLAELNTQISTSLIDTDSLTSTYWCRYDGTDLDCDLNPTTLAGDHLTWSGTDLDVEDDFVLNTGDTMVGDYEITGNLDMDDGNISNVAVIETTGGYLITGTGSGIGLTENGTNSTYLSNGLNEVYTVYVADGFDTVISGSSGSDDDSHEFDVITADQLNDVEYLEISVTTTNVFDTTRDSNNMYTLFKIETKDVGGLYAESLPYTYLSTQFLGIDNGKQQDKDETKTIIWLHTLTTDEKTNGVQVKISTRSSQSIGTSSSVSCSNVQTVIRPAYVK